MSMLSPSEQLWFNMQVPLNDTLREVIASGFVHYEYSALDFVDSTTGGTPQCRSSCLPWDLQVSQAISERRTDM